MRRGASRLAVLALASVLAACARPACAASWSDPSCGTTPIVGSTTQNRFRLPHTFLRAGSDSAWTRTRAWVRGTDYALDALRGDLRLLSTLAPGETLWVTACWLTAPPPLEYAKQVYRPLAEPGLGAVAPADSIAPATVRPSTGRDIGAGPLGSTLALSGNKTVAVDFGSSQDAALRQSLDLAISGQVSPGVELTGVLTDRNTPLTSGGATEDLQSIDRVLVELKAKHARAALGDIPLAVESGAFSKLERRVQGVRGDWLGEHFRASGAAASAQGEYRRLQFAGVDGLQGPYTLTGPDGTTGAGVVAGSEIVTVDGQRMTRGESADYSMDYERARITFTNRRPVTSASRITVEYQAAVTRFRRNLAAGDVAWDRGPVKLFASVLDESDDGGRPLEVAFDANDHYTLAAAGDSASLAVGVAVTPGGGDYDTVRVAPDTLAFRWAGPDAGQFNVRFTRVGEARGDYVDSAVVAGRTAYRWVGAGRGAFVVGRSLPLPESHQLVSLGGTGRVGPFTLEAEGAASRYDRNTFSTLDDGDNSGGAARALLAIEGRAGFLPGKAGASFGARSVERTFTPFARLERPFTEEDWGLPRGADLDHQKRAEGAAWWRPREGSELRGDWSRLTTPDGYAGTLRRAEWTSTGNTASRLAWTDGEGEQSGLAHPDAARRRWQGEVRRTWSLLTPLARFELDDRHTPGDTAAVRDRAEEAAADLASGARVPFRLAFGATLRRDRHEAGLTQGELRSAAWRVSGESPAASPYGVAAGFQRREVRDVPAGTRTQADLATVRLRAEHRPSGLAGHFDTEVTGEAENVRERVLTYVGPGQGSYDALGNFVGTGDYELLLVVKPDLERLTRVVSSARARWDFGSSATWRGSRAEFSFESEARRRGDLRPTDAILSTGIVLDDPELARGSVAQRLEGEMAPGSRAAALRLRLERRVTADRTYVDFAQVTDLRNGSLRWRARPGPALTFETEVHAQWQRAEQASTGQSYARTLLDEGAQAQLAWQPRPAARLAGAAELSFSRPQGQVDATRTIRIGPDAGMPVGSRGRVEVTARRAFVSGPPPVTLLPGVDPAGFPRWEGTGRFDLRLHETTTAGVSAGVKEFPGRSAIATGRAEVRAFF